jgi:hypothetical protein
VFATKVSYVLTRKNQHPDEENQELTEKVDEIRVQNEDIDRWWKIGVGIMAPNISKNILPVAPKKCVSNNTVT